MFYLFICRGPVWSIGYNTGSEVLWGLSPTPGESWWLFCFERKKKVQIRQIAQCLKVLAAKSDDLSSMLGTYIVEKDLSPASCLLASVHMPRHVCSHTHANK